MISYVLPTRDRPERLKETLRALEKLGHGPGEAEILVADNASRERLILPRMIGSMPVTSINLDTNEGAAARNRGARESNPASSWIVMLDDDSYPNDTRFLDRLAAQPDDVGAVSADIVLENGHRESGGLPEVFIGCGVAIRRDLFLRMGGYDHTFGYYVEEYDLAARMLLSGYRVAFDPAFRVTHAKVPGGRNMDLILSRLVRNNGWVAQRYAPEAARLDDIRETRRRYRRIASKEMALAGYTHGLLELRRTVRSQHRTPMPNALWDRFTGLSYAREALHAAWRERRFNTAAIVDEGKNSRLVAQVLAELGVRLTGEGEDAETIVIGTLSPGPMLDAFERRLRHRFPGAPRVIAPWNIRREPAKPARALAAA